MWWHITGSGIRVQGQGLRSVCFKGLSGSAATSKTLVNTKFIRGISKAGGNKLSHSSLCPVIILSPGRMCLTNERLISGLRLSSQSSSGAKPRMEVNKEPVGDSTLRDRKDEETSQKKTDDGSSKVVSRKDKLKQAVKDYGLIVIGFHITISLASLGFCYLLVSSGIDMMELLRKIGIGEHLLEGRMAAGASTFVVAYAIHKVFAPGRIAVTLAAAPVIVNKLRKLGILKKVASKSK